MGEEQKTESKTTLAELDAERARLEEEARLACEVELNAVLARHGFAIVPRTVIEGLRIVETTVRVVRPPRK